MCDPANIIHVTTLQRMANKHTDLAKKYIGFVKKEVNNLRKTKNSHKPDMVKNMARELTERYAQPLNFAERDRNTRDGGQVGDITANPQEGDGIVKRAWKKSMMAPQNP